MRMRTGRYSQLLDKTEYSTRCYQGTHGLCKNTKTQCTCECHKENK